MIFKQSIPSIVGPVNFLDQIEEHKDVWTVSIEKTATQKTNANLCTNANTCNNKILEEKITITCMKHFKLIWFNQKALSGYLIFFHS